MSNSLLGDLISKLRSKENERLLEAMAREINNHIFIRGTFTTSGAQELTSEDMQIILARLTIVESTLALSARGQGPEAYAPKRPTPTHPIPLHDPNANTANARIMDKLENDLRSSHGGRQ